MAMEAPKLIIASLDRVEFRDLKLREACLIAGIEPVRKRPGLLEVAKYSVRSRRKAKVAFKMFLQDIQDNRLTPVIKAVSGMIL